MAHSLSCADDSTLRRSRVFERMFRGYRFRVCEDPVDVARALHVRRTVYQDGCGYDVPIPDQYDHRSWLLVAEETTSGRAVGTMRLTPRAQGTLEAEEYFALPLPFASRWAVELTRFAILPEHRSRTRVLPVVAAGLVKLAIRLLQHVDASFVVVCATPERAWLYKWLNLEGSGQSAPYGKLGNKMHELLLGDLRAGIETFDHRFKRSFFDVDHPEIVLPVGLPKLAGHSETERKVA